MKPFSTLLAAALCASAAHAAPRLHLSTPNLGPDTEIELILDRAAVADDALGKPAPAADWLVFAPPLKARLMWKSPNIARVLLDETPAIGTSYQCSLPGGHKHLDGSPVPAGLVGKIDTEPFKIEWRTVVNRYSENYNPRVAKVAVRFNDDANPADVAPFFYFSTDDKNNRIPAKATRPDYDTTSKYYLKSSWSDRFRECRIKAENPDAAVPQPGRNNLVLIFPAVPLPIGKNWILTAKAGIPNAAGNAGTRSVTTLGIGTVQPFTVDSIDSHISEDSPRRIIVSFSESLPKGFDAARFIRISPEPANISYETRGATVSITGDLRARDKWKVTVLPGFSSATGLPLAKDGSETVNFELLAAKTAVPSHDGPQLASGTRTYRIASVNVGTLHVRAKSLSGAALLRTMQGYRHYTGDGPDNKRLSRVGALPWELITGTPLFDLEIPVENPIDKLRFSTLDWNKLLPPGTRHAVFFLDVRGTPVENAPRRNNRDPLSQAIIQLTDIGIGWKLSPDNILLYAFSLQTGEPLPGVKFEFFGEDAKKLADDAASDADGLATVARDPAARHLLARLGDDSFVVAFDQALPTVGLWHFPVRYEYGDPKTQKRNAFLFTDRSLYRPGETIHLKGIVRKLDGNAVRPTDMARTRMVVIDPAEREIRKVPVKLSQNGTFDFSMRLPSETVGTFEFRFEYAKDADRAEQADGWWEKWEILANSRFVLNVPVAEFRRNAFEITHKLAPTKPGASEVSLDLAADYYQGRPVALGEVQVWTRITNRNFYPKRYRDFLFGDHRSYDPWYWAYYFGYSDGSASARSKAETAKLKLDKSGRATVTSPLPETKLPSTRVVRIATEVTDSNHQSLTLASETMVHPAAIYAGIGRIDRLIRAGDTIGIPVVAVTPKGQPYGQPVEMKVVVTREINEQVKIAGKNGRTAVRNETRIEPVSESTIATDPAANASQGTPFSFHPTHPGRHIVAISGTDADGRPFLTQTQIHVYGTDEYPWAYEDGIKIKLVPEKQRYRPGETARILVLSPIEGTALVTVEREGILRSFRTRLTADKPVIEIPLSNNDAPNAYVSVLVVKGAKDSARKHPEPQLRLGYCELNVENVRDRLAVTLHASGASQPTASAAPAADESPEFLPGESVTLSGTVLRADGTPAAGAEITVWAEDAGVLAVAGYDCPKPMGFFYAPRNLAIRSGTSMAMLLPESPDEQQFFNKGFWIGGGGWDEANSARMRRDFRPCAVWAPTLAADKTGNFHVSFTAPDTLTRYRLFAVACDGPTRFGAAESALVVNRPLMLQPKAPRFALAGDTIVLPVTVQNASDYAGTWKITLKQNDTVAAEQSVEIEPGKSVTINHPVAFSETGESIFQWTAVPVSLRDRQLDKELARRLSDAVEHPVPVDFPAPLLRAIRTVALDGDSGARDLLDGIDSALRDASGRVEIELARSPLIEAGGAVDYLLHYPYGCVEQTTSALMPWFAVAPLRPYVPSLAKVPEKKVDAAIAKGVERLLAMQLPDGGFSYWIGSDDRLDWASSYAGLGLVMAKNAGAEVPDSAIDLVCKDLSKSLRGLDKTRNPYDLELATRSLWVLSLAEKPEWPYINKLIERISDLNRRSRCLLALAAAATETDGSREIAMEILRDKTPLKAAAVRDPRWNWMPWTSDRAIELLAWSTAAPRSHEAAAALDKLLRDRSPYGHWRTTWVNSWALLGMAEFARHDDSAGRSVAVTIEAPGGAARTFALNSENPTATMSVPLAPGLTLPATTDGSAFLRVKLAARPAVAPLKPVARNGMEITRSWEIVRPDGTRAPLATPHPGDLVLVTLHVIMPTDGSRYLVVEDRLPAIFETVNEEFASQSAEGVSTARQWQISHKELRGDRASFFIDFSPHRGTYTIQYLARCTLPGTATAPPAKIESMYDPENVALSASRTFTAE